MHPTDHWFLTIKSETLFTLRIKKMQLIFNVQIYSVVRFGYYSQCPQIKEMELKLGLFCHHGLLLLKNIKKNFFINASIYRSWCDMMIWIEFDHPTTGVICGYAYILHLKKLCYANGNRESVLIHFPEREQG